MASHSQSLPPAAMPTIRAMSRKDGTTSSISSSHMPTRSNQPSKNATAVPTRAAMIVVPNELKIPMVNERPRPRMIIAYISEPPTVVPSQCWADGGEARAAKSGSS